MAVSRIFELNVVGGFLDGMNLQFNAGLNCIIGSRGAGKTSVLEFLRYALDAMPEAESATAEHKRITRLIESNLGGGTIRVRLQGVDGSIYVVSRAKGEPPLVRADDDSFTALAPNNIIQLHAHSQSEVEAIADDGAAQLELIDRFESEKLQQVSARLRDVRNSLRTNASKIMEVRDKLSGLDDSLTALEGIEEKLARLAPVVKDGGKDVEQASDAKALRQREAQALNAAMLALREVQRRCTEIGSPLQESVAEFAQTDLRDGPNGAAIRDIHKQLQAVREWIDAQGRQILARLESESAGVAQAQSKLLRTHQEQDQVFQTLLEKHREMQGPARERAQLEAQRQQLLAVKGGKEALDKELVGLERERTALLSEVADLQVSRHGLRNQIVKRINIDLADQVRVGIENLGDQDDYRKLVEEILRKNTGKGGGAVTPKLVSLPPSELVELLRARDLSGLADKAGITAQQAARVVPALSEPLAILDLEAVALRDKPKIELNDQGIFKGTGELSKGQKCTAVLPILLMDGQRPLLIDQPEDNLDNRFICRVVVDKIQKVKHNRQIIFATHNPNVVVLGAADRVIVLESNGKTSQLLRQGTVDELKKDILALLEGGAEAFEQRRVRYGN